MVAIASNSRYLVGDDKFGRASVDVVIVTSLTAWRPKLRYVEGMLVRAISVSILLAMTGCGSAATSSSAGPTRTSTVLTLPNRISGKTNGCKIWKGTLAPVFDKAIADGNLAPLIRVVSGMLPYSTTPKGDPEEPWPSLVGLAAVVGGQFNADVSALNADVQRSSNVSSIGVAVIRAKPADQTAIQTATARVSADCLG